MTLDEARKIVVEWEGPDGEGLLERYAYQKALGLIEGHALGQAEERKRCISIFESKHYCTGLCFVCLKRDEILKGEAEGK